jgi:hypothetical protein
LVWLAVECPQPSPSQHTQRRSQLSFSIQCSCRL